MTAFYLSERSARRQALSTPIPEVADDLASVLSALDAVSILLDADGEVIRATPDAYTTGLVRQGRVWSEGIQALISTARAEGAVAKDQLFTPRSPLPGSEEFYLEVTVAPLADSRVLILAVDHTAAHRLQQVRTDFVANVSHELKTPVGAISLLAETVVAASDDPAAVQRFGTRMLTEVTRLSELVQDIIDLSRLEAPEEKQEFTQILVSEVVDEAIDRVQVQAEDAGVTISHNVPQELLVLGDFGLLVTAVRNLLDNAIRYSPDGSTVGISVRLREAVVEFLVVDRGPGIAAVEQDRVFERFYRGDPARSRRTGGTGLGLSIVRHVAANHGGNVTLWSAPGRGATFTLRIPEAEANTPLMQGEAG